MLPAQQFATSSMKSYRELLRKFHTQSQVEDSSVLFEVAKRKVFVNLLAKREQVVLDPKGAFARLKQKLSEARTNLKELRKEKAQQLRLAYDAVKRNSQEKVASFSGRQATTQTAQLEQMFGKDGLLRATVTGGVGTACRLFMQHATYTTIQGAHNLENALKRPPGQPLITVSNHVAAIDDPLIVAALIPQEYVYRPETLRWTLCATDRCFKHKLLSSFFRAGKVLPVSRGAGVNQPGMKAAESLLNEGQWVHVFPEGTRSRDAKMGPVRKGVGHLVAACAQPPFIVPFVHSGMENVVPRGAVLPKTGQQVKIKVGEPVEVADLIQASRTYRWTEDQLSLAIANRIGQSLYTLKAELDGAAQPRFELNTDDSLLPLIEEEMDWMTRKGKNRLRDRLWSTAAYAFPQLTLASHGVAAPGLPVLAAVDATQGQGETACEAVCAGGSSRGVECGQQNGRDTLVKCGSMGSIARSTSGVHQPLDLTVLSMLRTISRQQKQALSHKVDLLVSYMNERGQSVRQMLEVA